MELKTIFTTLVVLSLIISATPNIAFAEEAAETAQVETVVEINTTGEITEEVEIESEEDDDAETTAIDLDETAESGEADGEEINTGILPDHPLYAFKTFSERVRLMVTFRQEARIKLRMRFAERRLLEAEKMAEKNNTQAVERLMVKYQDQLSRVEQRRSQLTEAIAEKEDAAGEDIDEHMERKATVHQVILNRMRDKISEQTSEEASEEAEDTIEEVITANQARKAEIAQRITDRVQARTATRTAAGR